MGDKRRCIYPCAFGASRHFFCGAMCSREDGHQGGCRCGVHHEPLTPPEPAAPVVGKLIIDPTPLPFRGSFDDEPAAPRPMTDADLTRAGVYAPEPAAPAPEPDEAERVARDMAESHSLSRYTETCIRDELRAADRRGAARAAEADEALVAEYLDAPAESLTRDAQQLADALRAAERRGWERALGHAEGIVASAPTPDAVRRIRALASRGPR